ncbi:MAG: MaoC family dehydratase [Acidobacteriota bacterium]|nr:MaoC family dehydratase [Acidobacteriota bacterium]
MPRWVPKESLLAMAGREFGPSSWLEIDQDRIDRFADATLDRQFIHVDPDKAARTPFGGTIAHGFLSLSLLPFLSEEHAVAPEGTAMAINYGLNKVRFLQPVRAGSRVRLHSKIIAVDEKTGGRILVRGEATLELEGHAKPALVAETLSMYFVEKKG